MNTFNTYVRSNSVVYVVTKWINLPSSQLFFTVVRPTFSHRNVSELKTSPCSIGRQRPSLKWPHKENYIYKLTYNANVTCCCSLFAVTGPQSVSRARAASAVTCHGTSRNLNQSIPLASSYIRHRNLVSFVSNSE